MALDRRQFLTVSSLALVGSAIRMPAWAQAPAPPQTAFTDLRRGVGVFTGNGGTIGWLITPDGALAVDSQFPQTAEACIAGLKPRAPRGIELLINTHHHGDHTAGNITFRPVVKKIVQHENCATWQKQTAQKAGNQDKQAYADQTFATDWTTTLGGERISATYYGPGHTSGDAVIHFEQADVVHMGDLMFNHLHPFIDRPAGASIRNWIRALEQVSTKHAGAMFIFGHGKDNQVTGTSKDLLFFRDYLTAVLDRTQQGIKAGQSQDEIARTASLRGFEDFASPAPILSLSAVLGVAYEEITSK